MSSELAGYRGEALKVLMIAGAKIGDIVKVVKDGETYEGTLIPRAEYGDDKHILIKLGTGYNIGLRVSPTIAVTVIGHGAKPSFIRPPPPEQKEGLPKVAVISTGGTIASKVDYRTGAVEPALTAEDLYSIIPELSEIARIDAHVLFGEFSENLTPKHWKETALTVANHIKSGAEGVVVCHGTDTMGYTAAALSFALQELPVPVVLVGSQRSSDRPSSDAATNLMGATTTAAKAPFAEVVLAMHEKSSDEFMVIHRGTKVRKCHTSRRDTFKSINSPPLARLNFNNQQFEILVEDYSKRKAGDGPLVRPDFEEKVGLIKFHPGMNPEIIDWFNEKRYLGLILEGTGLGHVSRYCYEPIKRAIKNGIVIGMTSQCLWGRVDMAVYYTGRDLLSFGVIPLEDMLPETALIKMMWAFGQTKDPTEVKKIMAKNIAHEVSMRRFDEGKPTEQDK